MKDDLLDADASVRWAVSNLPSFEQRLKAWVDDNIHMSVMELPSEPGKDALIMVERERLPYAFNAEAGAYINAIRSSLDMVASALAERDMVIPKDKVYFPVAGNAAEFAAGNYKGSKFVNSLCGTNRKIIEAIRPYKGGNNLLFFLHELDVMRKHRRLLKVRVSPLTLTYSGAGLELFGDLPETRTRRIAPDATLLAFLTERGKQPELKLSALVSFDEANFGFDAVVAIKLLAETADTIINAFDF